MRTSRLRSLSAGAAVLLATAALSGCVLLEGPPLDTPERTTPAQPDAPVEFIPDGTAAENLPYFTETVREFAAGGDAVEGRPLVDALASAGFSKDHMQVSFDQSKTGLTADHIYASVRVESECLIAQVVSDDRTFAVEVAPTVGPEDDLCLIGETRTIDW